MIELLVAVVLIDVGMLALVAESGVLVRARNGLRARAVANAAAANRLQVIAASPCSAAFGSAVVAPGVRETWTVTLGPGSWRRVSDSVSFDVGTVVHAVVLHTRVPC